MARGRKSRDWTAAITHFQEEQRAAHHIEKSGFNYYLPFIKVPDEKGVACLRRLMFPGYIFIQLKSSWQSILHLPGIRKVFLFEEKPIPVPRKDIDLLKSMEGADGAVKLPETVVLPDRLQPGMRVTLCDKLNALSGKTLRVVMMRTQERCEVSLRLMGRDIRTTVSSSALEIV